MKTLSNRPGNRHRTRHTAGTAGSKTGHVPRDRVMVGFTIPLDLRLKLEARADSEDASMTMVATDALRAYLAGDGVT